MRPARPWYRTGRDTWQVQFNGKQVLLARGKANKSEAIEERTLILESVRDQAFRSFLNALSLNRNPRRNHSQC